MRAFGRCPFLRNEVCLIKFSFKWKSKYFIWKLRCSANFYTFINDFRFKALPLGGPELKSACGTKYAEFRKTSAISWIFIKNSWFFFSWKIWQTGCFDDNWRNKRQICTQWVKSSWLKVVMIIYWESLKLNADLMIYPKTWLSLNVC